MRAGQSPAALLRQVWQQALGSFDLHAHVHHALAKALPRQPPVDLVIAVGKMAGPMLAAARGLLPKRAHVLVIAPDGAVIGRGAHELMRAAHPIPDARSVRAAQRAQAAIAKSTSVLVLLSGGASALMCDPSLPLSQYQALAQGLLLSGANISGINAVRRHLSRTGGGRLAALAFPRPVLTVAVSDVIAGRRRDIGSGPTLFDPDGLLRAQAVLQRHGLSVPSGALLPPVPQERLRHARFVMAVSAAGFCAHTAGLLSARGLQPRVLAPSLASAPRLAAQYAAMRLAHGQCIVRAAEPRLVVPAQGVGRGGRCTHLAALMAPWLRPDHAFLAGATDGVDGASQTSGAIVGREHATPAVARSLLSFDTGAALSSARATLRAGPTGLNFADVHVLLRAPRRTDAAR
jgi:hydroxypyruvate reductase